MDARCLDMISPGTTFYVTRDGLTFCLECGYRWANAQQDGKSAPL